ncbi:MAG: hypothetical protein WBC05_18830 [Sedimentisphaerales bacterium]
MKRKNNILEVLMDAVCCVMCADKKVATPERKAVHRILEKVKAPWDKNEIDRRIDIFIHRAKKEGLLSLTQEVCHKLIIFKRKGKEQVLLRCVEYMAQADGIIDPRETELCQKFRTVLSDETASDVSPPVQAYEPHTKQAGHREGTTSLCRDDTGTHKTINNIAGIKAELNRLRKQAGAKWKVTQCICISFSIVVALIGIAALAICGILAYLAAKAIIPTIGSILGWIVGSLTFLLCIRIYVKFAPFAHLETRLYKWQESLFPEILPLTRRLKRAQAEDYNERGIQCFRIKSVRKRTGTAGRPPEIRQAIKYFRKAMFADNSWAVPCMNLGRCFYYCNLLLSGKNLVNMAQEKCEALTDSRNDKRVANDAQYLIEEVIACGANWFELDFIIDPNSFISSHPGSSPIGSPP